MSRTHVARVLDRDQIRALQCLLEGVSGRRHPIDLKAPTFEVCSPDGDIVFAGIRHSSGLWICRLHREVFSPGP
jgi:hypothetical protein